MCVTLSVVILVKESTCNKKIVFVGWFGGWLVMGAVSRLWLMGLVLVILGCDSRNWPNQGSRKSEVLVVMDPPPKILTFFFEFVSMLVKLSENVFWG